VTFYQFPREHWPHLRTTNPVESPFATVRLCTTAAKRFKKVENATALIWKILQVAESTFRRLKGAELLPAVYAGAQYVDGIQQSTNRQQQIAA
jgi:putative transposase